MEFFSDYSMTINGKSVRTQGTLEVTNPAVEEIIGIVPNASKAELDSAVTSAKEAFPAWRDTPIKQRQALLGKASEIIEAHIDELAELLTCEQGRALPFAKIEIEEVIKTYSTFSKMLPPVQITEDSNIRRVEVHYEPLGVVGAISPWNFPAQLSAWKVAPAILAGNTVVLKPSPFTPLCNLKIAELLIDVFPPGVFNVISGDDNLGPLMTAHPGFNKISFTGSTATGKRVMQNCVNDLKRITLELGGNDAAIILPDVDVKGIAESVFFGAFYSSAQICVATKRLYVHEDIYEELLEELKNLINNIKVGNGLEEGTILGPLQNKRQYDRVKELIESSRKSGLNLIQGQIPTGKGYFVPVTLVDNPPRDSRVVKEEAFGPVLPMIKFDNFDDLLLQVNDSEYGLAGSIWSSDIDKAVELAHKIETGTVWINENLYLPLSTPFGGRKQSGLGVENGMEGLLGFMAPKSIYIPKPQTSE